MVAGTASMLTAGALTAAAIVHLDWTRSPFACVLVGINHPLLKRSYQHFLEEVAMPDSHRLVSIRKSRGYR